MVNIKQAIDAVLRQEDATLSGVITDRQNDRGGFTRFGLCARFHPGLVSSGFYDEEKVSTDEALKIAEATYLESYTAPLRLEDFDTQGIVTALLSFAVNEGIHEAVVLLQKAVNACGEAVSVDGIVGPMTCAAVNRTDPQKLAATWGLFQESFYRHIVAVNSTQQANIHGWLNRVKQNLEFVAAVVDRN